RRDRVDDADAARNHLGQHRLEDDVVVPADEPELDLAAVELGSEKPLQRQRRVDAAEASAKHEDAHRARGCHACPPIFLDALPGAPPSASTATTSSSVGDVRRRRVSGPESPAPSPMTLP